MRTSLRCEMFLTPLLALPRTMSIRLQRVELWPMEAGDHWPLHPGLQFICRLCSAVSLSAALQSAPALTVTITYQSITVSRPLTSNWSFSQPEGRRIIIRLVQRINRFIALVCIESKYYREPPLLSAAAQPSLLTRVPSGLTGWLLNLLFLF